MLEWATRQASEQRFPAAAWQGAESMTVMGMAPVRLSVARWQATTSALLWAQPLVTPSQAMAATLRKGIPFQETRLLA